MILVVDIGNSTIAAGLVLDGSIRAQMRLMTEKLSVSAFKSIFHDFLQTSEIPLEDIETTVISCVVPPILKPVSTSLNQLIGKTEFIVQPGIKVGMQIHYQPPGSLGPDRVVNAFATKIFYGYPAICIDFGTATTFCVLDQKGDFTGGAILPGIKAFSTVLSKTTSLLPDVSFAKPPTVIAQSTIHNIQSGLFFGYISLLEGLIDKIQVEMRCKAIVVATGGQAGLIKDETNAIDYYDNTLTLLGLAHLYRYNRKADSEFIWQG